MALKGVPSKPGQSSNIVTRIFSQAIFIVKGNACAHLRAAILTACAKAESHPRGSADRFFMNDRCLAQDKNFFEGKRTAGWQLAVPPNFQGFSPSTVWPRVVPLSRDASSHKVISRRLSIDT
jgi:hypothetical protein